MRPTERRGQRSSGGIDIAHFSFRPPSVAGSYNRFIARQMRELPFSQVVVSSDTFEREVGPETSNTILVGRDRLKRGQKIMLRTPDRVRMMMFDGITGSETLAYLWGAREVLTRLRPRLIMCYDGYKYARLLRPLIYWPSRLVLAQHGHSYLLSPTQTSEVYSIRSFDAVVVLSHSAYKFERSRVHAYEPPVVVIPNGVDVAEFRPPGAQEKELLRGRFGLDQGRKIVLALGRLVPKKGVHLLVHSWRRVIESAPEALLWIVGDGPPQYVNYLRYLARVTEVDNSVVFQGAIRPELVGECHRAADIFVFPTVAMEGSGLSLLEAMASGLPCVASEYPALNELDVESGIVIVTEPNLLHAFVEPVLHLLEHDHLREKLGSAARAIVEERFSSEHFLGRLEDFYTQMLTTVRE
jgi:spore coat protein SA